jgi:hypothetical protein
LVHTVILSFARLGPLTLCPVLSFSSLGYNYFKCGKSALYLGELYERIKELTGVPLAGQKIIGKITARIENHIKTLLTLFLAII